MEANQLRQLRQLLSNSIAGISFDGPFLQHDGFWMEQVIPFSEGETMESWELQHDPKDPFIHVALWRTYQQAVWIARPLRAVMLVTREQCSIRVFDSFEQLDAHLEQFAVAGVATQVTKAA